MFFMYENEAGKKGLKHWAPDFNNTIPNNYTVVYLVNRLYSILSCRCSIIFSCQFLNNHMTTDIQQTNYYIMSLNINGIN